MRSKRNRKTLSRTRTMACEPTVFTQRVKTPRDWNPFLIALGCFVLLVLAGMGYALYLRLYCEMDHSTWKNHLLQWWPFVSAVGALVFGLRRIQTDTAFAEFGLIGLFAVGMPVGYVLGRLLFF